MAHPVETIQCSVTKTKKHIVHVLFTNITIHKLKRKLTKSASKRFKKKIKESHVLLLKGSHKVILQYIIVVFQPTRMLNIEKFILILCLVKPGSVSCSDKMFPFEALAIVRSFRHSPLVFKT